MKKASAAAILHTSPVDRLASRINSLALSGGQAEQSGQKPIRMTGAGNTSKVGRTVSAAMESDDIRCHDLLALRPPENLPKNK
jgi:hypothetical protein